MAGDLTLMRARTSQRGFMLLMSLGVTVFVAIVGAASMVRALHEAGVGRRNADQQQAFYLAEAGLDRASMNLRTPDEAADDLLSLTLPTGSSAAVGSYTIVQTADPLDPLRWTVTSTGTSSGTVRRLEVVYMLTRQSIFQQALFADVQVNVSGSAQTDSFDSRLGAYEDDPNDPGYNQGSNGDIGTNSIADGGITVGGSIFIEGQMVVGPGVDPPASIVNGCGDPPDCSSFVTSDPWVASQSAPVPMPAVTVPGGLAPWCADFTVQGNTTVTLDPTGGPLGNGTYCYRNLTIQGNANLTATGEVTVYLTGQLTAQGNSVVGVPDDPTQVLFKMTSTAGATLEQVIQGNNTFYGSIYGPDAEVNIQGNAKIYGSVIAEVVNVQGNARLHYDEALAMETRVINQYKRAVASWREL